MDRQHTGQLGGCEEAGRLRFGAAAPSIGTGGGGQEVRGRCRLARMSVGHEAQAVNGGDKELGVEGADCNFPSICALSCSRLQRAAARPRCFRHSRGTSRRSARNQLPRALQPGNVSGRVRQELRSVRRDDQEEHSGEVKVECKTVEPGET
ncbi:hypothetical protein BD413DRAFT_97222 [Trametes elegans]|nr:hypothetical protein BD413DRAFT_97222 [Trametes elegans]